MNQWGADLHRNIVCTNTADTWTRVWSMRGITGRRKCKWLLAENPYLSQSAKTKTDCPWIEPALRDVKPRQTAGPQYATLTVERARNI